MLGELGRETCIPPLTGADKWVGPNHRVYGVINLTPENTPRQADNRFLQAPSPLPNEEGACHVKTADLGGVIFLFFLPATTIQGWNIL